MPTCIHNVYPEFKLGLGEEPDDVPRNNQGQVD